MLVFVVVVLPIKVIPASQGMSVKRLPHTCGWENEEKKARKEKNADRKKKQQVRRIRRAMPIANKNKQTKTKRKEIFL